MKSPYHFTDGGLRNVWLVNGFTAHKTAYGEAVSIDDIDGLTKTICSTLVRKSGYLTGAEFRYLRLHLEMSQKSLGSMFGYSEQSVANWEKKGKVPKLADHHLRVLWTAKHENTTVKHLVERLNTVERLVSQRIVLKDTRAGWKAQADTASLA